MRKVTLGLVQMRCTSLPQQNFEHALHCIRKAAAKKANIICLPELFRTHYFCYEESYLPFHEAETVPGPSTESLCSFAKELGVVIIASLFEKRAPGLYHNTAVVIDADGSYKGKYRKMHIPDDPGYYEKFYFTPGDLGYQVFSTQFAKVAPLICWDQWYPEAARITALMGAEILFYPTAIGWAEGEDKEVNQQQYQAWQIIQRSHAIANGVHVASINRTGREGTSQFWGGSFVANPFGVLLHQASHEEEEIVIQTVNLEESDFYRTHWPFLRDRRIESYLPLMHRFLD